MLENTKSGSVERASLMAWWPIFREYISLTYLEMQMGSRLLRTWLAERCRFFSLLVDLIDATWRNCPEWILQHGSAGIYHHLSRLPGQLKPRRYLWPYKPAAEKQCCCKNEVTKTSETNPYPGSLFTFATCSVVHSRPWFQLFCTLKLQWKTK